MILNKTRASNLLRNIFNYSCKKRAKNCKFTRKKDYWKKIIVKKSITTKYIEYKQKKNNGTRTCNSYRISTVQSFNSAMKCRRTVSLKPFGLSVEIWSWFSRLASFYWVCNKDFTSFLETNLWTHDKLDIIMHEKDILWEVATLKEKWSILENCQIKKIFLKKIWK